MKLILTRHGETIENKKGVIQGHSPGRLSELGKEQAKKLALRLKSESLDAIYSSDLKRAADTTKQITKYHPNVPVYYIKELRERDLGHFSGKKGEEIDWNKTYKDIEPLENMQKRVKKLLDKVYNKYPKGTVLFVGHGGINLALITVIMHKPASHMKEMDTHSNTAVSIFEIKENKKHKIHLLNCVNHLR